MAFQFLCPNGHLLEGDDSEAGRECTCPHCGILFIIPEPLPIDPAGGADAESSTVAPAPAPAPAPLEQPTEPDTFPGISTGPFDQSSGPPAATPGQVAPLRPSEQPILHIVCPSGHELETPREMLGQYAMCPFCQARFRLRLEDSVQHRRQRAEERARREQRIIKTWMNWTIAAAAVVVLAVILMMAIAVSN